MADLAIPDLTRPNPPEIEFGLKSNSQVSTSDLSGAVQTVELPGARWTMGLRWPNRNREDADLLMAWLAQLRGQANRARVPVYHRRSPRGTWGGSPVTGTVTSTTSIPVTGFSAGATVRRGDLFNVGVNGQLVMVVADATASGGGAATLTIEPPLRSLPGVGVALISANPVVPQMILTDPHPRLTNHAPDLSDFALEFIEVFA